MHVAYEPENLIEAHLIKGLLAQAGIVAHIRGEYLTGAMGELPAMGLLAVMVDDDDADAARALIADWRAAAPDTDNPLPDEGFFIA
ncbi:DUF2007 domain-containing protein [Xanthomonadaceae bacterium JHOS43]|nr:DUF2007 domain-containing protein [Xanthomonadaceae bacterium JHOS43]